MRKGRLFVLLAFNLLFHVVFMYEAYAIPSLTNHCHTGTVKWFRDLNSDGILQPDAEPHNHRTNRRFVADDFEEPYGVNSCWDNTQFRPPTGLYDTNNAHGFIDESNSANVPTYSFSNKFQAWPEAAKDSVRYAFDQYGAITSDKADLVTGIGFREDTTGAGQIKVYWMHLTAWGTFWPASLELGFDASPPNPWDFSPTLPIPSGSAHFLTIALHEIGHVVGSTHQDDKGDLMYVSIDPTDPTQMKGTVTIDVGIMELVRDVYSIPKPPCVGGVVVPVDKFGLLAPYIGLASTILVATVATAIYVKRVKRREEKQ